MGSGQLGCWWAVLAICGQAWSCGAAATTQSGAGSVRRTPIVEAVAKAYPAVVNVGTEEVVERTELVPVFPFRTPGFSRYFPMFRAIPRRESRRHLGSGVLVDETGYVLTNSHVVKGAARIEVNLADGRTLPAQLVSDDEHNDLALLRIEAAADARFQYIEFADPEDLLLGETVIALGNPFDYGHTVTSGIISGLNRPLYDQETGELLFEDILQTDAAINPGNSGGPLINLEGQLVGVNLAILLASEGISFAIPVGRCIPVVTRWFETEVDRRVQLGFTLSKDGAGATIERVEADGPAAAAGLAPGDRIVGIDAAAVHDRLGLLRALLELDPGDRPRLRVARGGREEQVVLAVAAPAVRSGFDLAWQRLGLRLQRIDEEVAQKLGINVSQGLVVVEVDAACDAAGRIVPGNILARIDDTRVRSAEDVALALDECRAGEQVALGVIHIEPQGWRRPPSVYGRYISVQVR